MAATNVLMNVSGVTYNSQTFTNVAGVQWGENAETQRFIGDASLYDTVVVNSRVQHTVTIAGANFDKIFGASRGLYSNLVWVQRDAKNGVGASSGAITWTLANATVIEKTGGQSHGAFGQASVSFAGASSDGTTNPLSYAVA